MAAPDAALSVDLLRALVHGSNLAINVFRLEDPLDLGSFRLLYANPAAAAHSGVSYEAMAEDFGKTFREFVPGILETDTPMRCRRVLELGEAESWGLRYGDAKYPSIVRRLHAWPLDAATLALAYTNVTREHETQRQLAENMEALRIAYDNLEASRARQVQVEKLASLGQMSAGIAHEINNPLLVIKGYARQARELLATEPLKEGAAIERFMSKIERGCARIEAITSRMSWYSRHAERSAGLLSVNQVVEAVAELIGPQLHSAGVDLVLSLCEPRPEIVGTELRLEQLLVNLILNARDAIADADDRPGRIEVSSAWAEGKIHLRVADNGSGIVDEVKRKMFDPFFSTKPPGAGTGLGLSIVHEIAQELGGGIECQTKVGCGTTFVVVLPSVGS